MIYFKGFELPGDIPLLFSVFFCLVYYSALLRIMPLKKIIALENHHFPARGKDDAAPEDKIFLDKAYRAAGFLLKRLWRSKKPCLRRSLVLARICRGRKLKNKIIIGVKKSGAGLESHAWVEIGSSPFGENRERLKAYTPIAGSMK